MVDYLSTFLCIYIYLQRFFSNMFGSYSVCFVSYCYYIFSILYSILVVFHICSVILVQDIIQKVHMYIYIYKY